MDERHNPNGSFSNFHAESSGGQDEDSIHLQAALNFIQNYRFMEAVRVLNEIKNRDAQWYYISAIANNGAHNYAIALEHAKMAAKLEPDRVEYQRYVEQLQGHNTSYQRMQHTYTPSFDSCCKFVLVQKTTVFLSTLILYHDSEKKSRVKCRISWKILCFVNFHKGNSIHRTNLQQESIERSR